LLLDCDNTSGVTWSFLEMERLTSSWWFSEDLDVVVLRGAGPWRYCLQTRAFGSRITEFLFLAVKHQTWVHPGLMRWKLHESQSTRCRDSVGGICSCVLRYVKSSSSTNGFRFGNFKTKPKRGTVFPMHPQA
jgi:hypothetical protein